MNTGDLDAADELMALDHVNHDPTAPDVPPGSEGVKQLIGMYRAAFPDLRFHTGEMFAVNGRVAHRWTFTGTHEGEMMGVEPTGRRVEVSATRHTHQRHLSGRFFDQPGASSFFEAVSGRSHSRETCAGCIVSLTTPTRSSLRALRSVSSLSFAEKASRVFVASYLRR